MNFPILSHDLLISAGNFQVQLPQSLHYLIRKLREIQQFFWVHWAFSMVSSNWTLVAHGMDFGMAKLRTSRRSSSCGMSHLGPSDMMIKFMEFVIENTSDIHLLQTSDLEE